MNEDTKLDLVLPLNVPFSQVLIAGEHFLRLSQHVTGEVIPGKGGDVAWVLEDFREGSLALEMQPRPIDQALLPAMPKLVDVIASGLRIIESEAVRPPYFTDTALFHAKGLAKLEGVEVKNGKVGARLTKALREHVDLVFGPEEAEWGTVEGRIESVTIRGQRAFNLYELVTGNKIECSFGHRISTDELGSAMGKRSAVSGVIVYRGDEVLRVTAEELEIFPSPEELPTADEVFGILAD
jgi:hypothetical protein